MKREEFLRYLENLGLTAKASQSRASWCKRVETTYGIDLDNIVNDKEKTLGLIESIYRNNSFTDRQRQNFPNAIRHYYSFINNDNIGPLRDNGR